MMHLLIMKKGPQQVELQEEVLVVQLRVGVVQEEQLEVVRQPEVRQLEVRQRVEVQQQVEVAVVQIQEC